MLPASPCIPVSTSATGTATPGTSTPLALFRRVASRLLDLVFPRDCAVTAKPVHNPPWRYLSPEALDTLPRVTGAHCETCGFPFFGVLAGAQICPHCRELDPVFQHGRTATLARGAVRKLVLDLKYHQAVWLVEDMARLIITTPDYAEFLRGALLVPVPLHPRRLRWRGYNQARVLLQQIVRLLPEYDLRLVDALVRTRYTTTQTRLDREARARNASGAFAIRPGYILDKGARYIVFDDVFTTGATLNACCAALARAGVTRLDVASVAHG
jgi:ComF family protein